MSGMMLRRASWSDHSGSGNRAYKPPDSQRDAPEVQRRTRATGGRRATTARTVQRPMRRHVIRGSYARGSRYLLVGRGATAGQRHVPCGCRSEDADRKGARSGAIRMPFQPHVVGAAELGVLHQQFVGTCAQLLASCRGRPSSRQLAVARRRDDRHRRRARHSDPGSWQYRTRHRALESAVRVASRKSSCCDRLAVLRSPSHLEAQSVALSVRANDEQE